MFLSYVKYKLSLGRFNRNSFNARDHRGMKPVRTGPSWVDEMGQQKYTGGSKPIDPHIFLGLHLGCTKCRKSTAI